MEIRLGTKDILSTSEYAVTSDVEILINTGSRGGNAVGPIKPIQNWTSGTSLNWTTFWPC